MSDLISREDAINAIYHHFPHVSMERATEILHECDSANRKGEWLDKGKEYIIRWTCSECGRRDKYVYNFCPDCGADMREENER